MVLRFINRAVLLLFMAAVVSWLPSILARAQNTTAAQTSTGSSPYVDQINGMTADEAVKYALAHNGELEAARKEIDAAKALVKIGRLRANPKVDLSVSQNVTGTDHNIEAM